MPGFYRIECSMKGRKKPDNTLRSKLLGYRHGRASSTSGSAEHRFTELATRCRNQAGSIGEAAVMQHPAWLEIVSLGEEAIPFMLELLEQDPTESWFSALQRVTGVNPVASNCGASAASAWLRWGRQRNISWRSKAAPTRAAGVLIGEEGDLVTVEVPNRFAKVVPAEAERLAAMLIRSARSIVSRKDGDQD